MLRQRIRSALINFFSAGSFIFGTAVASSALPAASIAEQAVVTAMTEPQVIAQKVNTPSSTKTSKDAATQRQKGVSQATQTTRNRAARTAVVKATAYNSTPGQTDSTPFITATGTRTRFGVVALSRDLLRLFPYGTRIRIEDLSGRYTSLLAGRVFVVEDTMHARKRNQVDIWMSSRSEALRWGARNVRITAVQ